MPTDDEKPIHKKLFNRVTDHLAGVIATAVAGIGATLLAKYGDKVFDGIQRVLGKQAMLIAAFVLACALAYCVVLLVQNRVRGDGKKMRHHRSVYYMQGDPVPFCPMCWELHRRKIHLIGPVETIDARSERWECHICDKIYGAKQGANFLVRERRGMGAVVI